MHMMCIIQILPPQVTLDVGPQCIFLIPGVSLLNLFQVRKPGVFSGWLIEVKLFVLGLFSTTQTEVFASVFCCEGYIYIYNI